MFSLYKHVILSVIFYLLIFKTCISEPVLPPVLVLFSPGDLEYTDVLVKRVHDNLTLVCEVRGDTTPRNYVWNYVRENGTAVGERPFTVEPLEPSASSKLLKTDLQVSDSGHYMCSAPPYSVTKYILVQTRGPKQCARAAFWCGVRCVLLANVCDGRADCLHGEDERPGMCAPDVCSRADKLNCSSGRCISESACCRTDSSLCQQPDCCNEYTRHNSLEGYIDMEFPAQYDDRHAPDDYGFIQSTIYTVTACALIFMIAVVLLVSAICKMQMKRAALRGYTHADRATRHHYSVQYAQAHRFPPCYEASRLLEQEGRPLSPGQSPQHSVTPPDAECGPEPPEPPSGLARLSSIFSSRYRQVPTQPSEVEMTEVSPSSPQSSPRRPPLPSYRSPTFCDLNPDFIFTDPQAASQARDLNYMATPIEFFRRRTMRRNTLERVMDQLDRQRLTLQLGRFQLSIPRFGRTDPRPDTPNVAEINIDDLDFVRLNSNETYTLNGRTIRLLGANFENYPVMPDGSVRPPSYTEAVRYKLYGPPPEYLSREGLNTSAERVDEEARSNIEMPPCYDDLGNRNQTELAMSDHNNATIEITNSDLCNGNSLENISLSTVNRDLDNDNGNVVNAPVPVHNGNNVSAISNDDVNNTVNFHRDISIDNIETLSSIIDNLPAIDSDVNANDPSDTLVNGNSLNMNDNSLNTNGNSLNTIDNSLTMNYNSLNTIDNSLNTNGNSLNRNDNSLLVNSQISNNNA